MKVDLFCKQKIPQLKKLKVFAQAVCKNQTGLQASGQINIIFVSAVQLRQLNVQFLKHDYDTDVITFAYQPTDLSASAPFGDVYISLDMARQQASLHGHSLLQELVLMIAHGLLHLCGYDDHTVNQRRRMFARQEELFALFKPPLPPVKLL